jgi:hypothetical protein
MEIQEHKKAIFLVEDFDGDRPLTLLECIYKKLDDKLRSDGTYTLSWLPEITNVLNDPRFDDIKFVAVRDFISQVNIAGSISDEYEVYYFISCFHNLENFHRSYFLAMDPEVTDFLVKHKIPVIIDASFETNYNYYQNTFEIFEAGIFANSNSINDHAVMYYRNLRELEFYVIGNLDYQQHEFRDRPRKVKVYHGVFSGPFFHHHANKNPVRVQLQKDLNKRLGIIANRTLTEDVLLWQAFSNTPRLTRALFQMRAREFRRGQFIKQGRYSRLMPMRETFMREAHQCRLFKFEKDNLKWITPESIDELDTVIHIDTDKLDNLNLFKTDLESMIWIVLECAYINRIKEFSNTVSEVTEKCMQPIINGHAFIPLGGQNIGNILKSYGFKEFPQLEFSTRPNFIKELNDVLERVWEIGIKPFKQRQEIFESWKDIAKHNLIHYATVNPQRLYLDMLHETKQRGT